LTQGDTPWSPSSFSDQVADKFYQYIIEGENYNARNEVTHPKLTFFDISDLRETHLKGKTVHLIFHADSIKECTINSKVLTSTDLHNSNALLARLIMKSIPVFSFRPHDVIQQRL
jgi:hypothetical protein